VSELDTSLRRARADRARGRALPKRWNFPADGVSRVACPCPSYLTLRQDAPGIPCQASSSRTPKRAASPKCHGSVFLPSVFLFGGCSSGGSWI
jgi:hypothetical protein